MNCNFTVTEPNLAFFNNSATKDSFVYLRDNNFPEIFKNIVPEWENAKSFGEANIIAKCRNYGTRRNPLSFSPVTQFDTALLKCSNSSVISFLFK